MSYAEFRGGEDPHVIHDTFCIIESEKLAVVQRHLSARDSPGESMDSVEDSRTNIPDAIKEAEKQQHHQQHHQQEPTSTSPSASTDVSATQLPSPTDTVASVASTANSIISALTTPSDKHVRKFINEFNLEPKHVGPKARPVGSLTNFLFFRESIT